MSTYRLSSTPESRAAKPKAAKPKVKKPRVTSPRLPRPQFTDVFGVAALMNCTPADVMRRLADDQMPGAFRPGDEDQWRIAEIKHWIKEGMPSREVWERRHYLKLR